MKNHREEFLSQINKANHSLIVLPDISDKETTAAGLALLNIIKSKNKKASLVSYKKLDPQLSFLNGYENILENIEHSRQFVLSFNTNRNKIKDVKWENEADKLNIYITPQNGTISPKDFSFAPGKYVYDTVIVLGITELESVGSIWEKHADLFYEVPIINIDYHISNEQFGQINIVDVKCCGVTEVLCSFLLGDSEHSENISKEASNCLYTGILESTGSFQSPRTTPNTLMFAARLIQGGADHKEIVRNLYKTHDIDSIKLWGKLMARMNYNTQNKLAWTKAYPKDFENTKRSTVNIRSIFDKIRASYCKGDTLMLLWENTKGLTRGLIQNSNRELLRDLLRGIEWGNAVIFEFQEPLKKAEPKILKILEEGYKTE